jgi:glyoxylase-like metal-dependent hydrolase (beta-lactamase superfamily II)
VQILSFQLGPLGTNAYLLFPAKGKEAVLIDAPMGAYAAVAPKLGDRKVVAVLLTHGHWDHIVDAAIWSGGGATIYAHPSDRLWIENPTLQSTFMPPMAPIPPTRVDELLLPNQVLELAGIRLQIRHVPGHSPGNVMFYVRDANAAFPGDAIMAGTVGRTDLPGGSWPDLEKSIRNQIYTLPGDTVLYPGHGSPTMVGTERTGNLFVRG